MKKVIALSETRLAGTLGHTIIIPARKPTRIPKSLYLEAAKRGCVDYDPRMAKAFLDALREAGELGDQDEIVINPQALAKQAVRKVMLLGDKSAFTANGVPKVAAVRRALDMQLEEDEITAEVALTKTMVYDVFLELQDEDALEAAPVSTVSKRQIKGDLEGEESGGSVEDMLERVGDAE